MLYPYEGPVSLEKAAKTLSAFAQISPTCKSFFRPACSVMPRNLVCSTRRMFLPPRWMVGGLLALSLPFSSIITVFSLDNCSFTEVHHSSSCCVTLVPTAFRIRRLLPEKRTKIWGRGSSPVDILCLGSCVHWHVFRLCWQILT